MKKRIILVVVTILLFLQISSAVDVSARSAILYEPTTKTVLFSKDIDTQREIASTTKILTALVVIENAELSEVVSIPKQCVGIEGTSLYLKEGEKLSVSDLLYGLLLRSGNDAAMTLAYHVGDGDINRFVDMMNETAKRLGMKNSSFKNPSGLPAEGHVSTAYDMALLTAYAMQNPEFSKIVATKNITLSGRAISNHNKLLRMYEGANGVKTGFTKSAGRCLVSSAARDGMSLIAVTLSAPDDWDDHTRLLDYGFDSFSLLTPHTAKESIATLPVVGGEVSEISAIVASVSSFLVKKADVKNVKTEIYLPRFLYAPVTQGDIIGEIRYILDGKVLATYSIVSGNTVKVYSKPSFFTRLIDIFRRV